jgi:hypothetical protein
MPLKAVSELRKEIAIDVPNIYWQTFAKPGVSKDISYPAFACVANCIYRDFVTIDFV